VPRCSCREHEGTCLIVLPSPLRGDEGAQRARRFGTREGPAQWKRQDVLPVRWTATRGGPGVKAAPGRRAMTDARETRRRDAFSAAAPNGGRRGRFLFFCRKYRIRPAAGTSWAVLRRLAKVEKYDVGLPIAAALRRASDVCRIPTEQRAGPEQRRFAKNPPPQIAPWMGKKNCDQPPGGARMSAPAIFEEGQTRMPGRGGGVVLDSAGRLSRRGARTCLQEISATQEDDDFESGNWNEFGALWHAAGRVRDQAAVPAGPASVARRGTYSYGRPRNVSGGGEGMEDRGSGCDRGTGAGVTAFV